MAGLEEDRANLLAKLQATEKQVQLLNAQMDQEKVQESELERLMSKERNMRHELELQIQNLDREKGELKTEIKALTAKVSGIFANKNHIALEGQMAASTSVKK